MKHQTAERFWKPREGAGDLRHKSSGRAFGPGPEDDGDQDSDLDEEPSTNMAAEDRKLFAKHANAPDNPIALKALQPKHARAKALRSAKAAGKRSIKGVVTKGEFAAHEREAKKAGARDPRAYAAAVLHRKLGYR